MHGGGGGVEVVVLDQSRSGMSPMDMGAHFKSGACVCDSCGPFHAEHRSGVGIWCGRGQSGVRSQPQVEAIVVEVF